MHVGLHGPGHHMPCGRGIMARQATHRSLVGRSRKAGARPRANVAARAQPVFLLCSRYHLPQATGHGRVDRISVRRETMAAYQDRARHGFISTRCNVARCHAWPRLASPRLGGISESEPGSREKGQQRANSGRCGVAFRMVAPQPDHCWRRCKARGDPFGRAWQGRLRRRRPPPRLRARPPTELAARREGRRAAGHCPDEEVS